MSYNLNIIYIICVLFQLEDWLEDSSWTNALVQANIASSGTGQHCQLWYRPTLPALVQANIASSGTGQHCQLWYRPTLPALGQQIASFEPAMLPRPAMHTKSQLQPTTHYSSRHTVTTAHRMMATPLSQMMRYSRSGVHSE